MDREIRRRGVLGAILGVGVAGTALSPARGYLDRLAPLTGTAWEQATDRPAERVESPHGEATVAYDDRGVPHVSGETEAATHFAAGYAQALDRRFQMDLGRRLMAGRLSAVVGEAAVESDRFHVAMDFEGAARATWEALADTETGAMVEAFAQGASRAIEREATPHEAALLEYEIDPWRPVDTLLMEKQIAWGLTGSFRTLRKALVRDRMGAEAATDLYPDRLDHEYPILREAAGGETEARRPPSRASSGRQPPGPDLVSWLSRFESPEGIGSNSWVVSGEHTESGRPILANDPHLPLQAPPVWYRMHLSPPSYDVRGVTFPGVPFVVIGENDHGAWGFTNAGADVIDFYRYDVESGGDRYVYRGDSRPFETEQRAVAVDGGEDREVVVRKTVHGPVIARHGRRVGVAWTGHTATETTVAIHEYARSAGREDVLAATRRFDVPTQNLVYADRSGGTLYQLTGRIPIRRTDGEPVPGNRIFDGSAGEGEWAGFEPYGRSSWEGFVPFEEKPSAVDPDYVATANQRIVDDPGFYLAEAYADPYRGRRIYRQLDERLETDRPVTIDFVRDLQLDTYDPLAASLVPTLVSAARERGVDPGGHLDDLAAWDARMDRDSTAALVFDEWLQRYRRSTFLPALEAAGLDDSFLPRDWVVEHLPPDSRWFGDDDRGTVMVEALVDAVEAIERAGQDTYGDRNTTGAIDHPLGLSHLGYPARPTDGSDRTVRNFDADAATGSSWRMLVEAGGESLGAIPGGNDGDPFSDHYADGLSDWADGRYRRLGGEPPASPAWRIEFGRDG